MTQTADRSLIAVIDAAVAGDAVAFSRIVAAYHEDMRRVCAFITRDDTMADEAVQSAWSLAWRKLGSLREPDRLRPWLVSVAVNQARDLLRKRRRRSATESAADVLAGALFAGDVWVAEEARITNDEGTWRGSAQGAEDDATLLAGEARYVGEGAYEGLAFHFYFFAEQDSSQGVYHGWISPISEPPAE